MVFMGPSQIREFSWTNRSLIELDAWPEAAMRFQSPDQPIARAKARCSPSGFILVSVCRACEERSRFVDSRGFYEETLANAFQAGEEQGR